MASTLLVLFLFTTGTISDVVHPTITNSSGVYYIASSDHAYYNEYIILCNDPSISCYIICNVSNGCTNTFINATLSPYSKLICTNTLSFSCNELIFHGSNSVTVIDCSGCYKSILYATITKNVSYFAESPGGSAKDVTIKPGILQWLIP